MAKMWNAQEDRMPGNPDRDHNSAFSDFSARLLVVCPWGCTDCVRNCILEILQTEVIMKIVVLKPPKFLRGLLATILGGKRS